MRAPQGNVLRVAVPLRNLVQRFAFVLLIGSAFALMLLGRFDNVAVERVRLGIVDAFTPIMDVASRPVSAVNAVVRDIREVVDLRTELARVKEENERLLQWQTVARRLEAENSGFRSLLTAKTETSSFLIAARVVADAGGPFVRTVLLNAGRRDGVSKGQAVVNADGMVGRVAEVGERSARILLLSDLNSRVPVVNERSGQRGVLAGDNSEWPLLVFLPNQAQVQPGDPIVTSGHGGLLPPGLPIGIVASIGDGGVRVQPLVNWHRLEFVRVVRYDLPRLESGANGKR
ncbi:MAG: rod shape-determining protein MreC [Alphaproteobacteria bacterium]|nr:rod shape-determining protein MreC [Alphaproteobacteria bacterium]